MFLVNSVWKGGRGGEGGGGLGGGLRECARRPGQWARGGGGRREGSDGCGTAARILGGVISAVSEAAAQYNPEPPPPRTHYSNIQANESEQVQQFWKLFAQLAGEDMEVSATELMNILNKIVTRRE